MTWREFWNQDTPIYVNERHKQVHYGLIARQLAQALPKEAARVLDFGCGEALSAGQLAPRCGALYLCDSADLVRGRLRERLAGHANVTVLAPEDIGTIPGGSLDLVVVNSVLQYLDRPELDRLLAQWRGLLSPKGTLLVADVVPPGVGPLTDALALLRLAAANGFLVAGVLGLARTFFSDYRAKRAELGLSQYEEAQIMQIIRSAGYDVRRRAENLGHNQARMAFEAQPA